MTRGKIWLVALACGVLLATPATPQKQPAGLPEPLPASNPAVEAPREAERPVATPDLTATDVSAWLDGMIPAALEQGKIAGAQVVIVKNGQVLLKKGYGYADVAAKTPMDPDRNLMRIGSTSKLFTWTAVLQQVEAGKIDLNADVNRYLDFRIPPKNGRVVTMNDLMTHTAGFEEGLKDVLATDPRKLQTTEQYLKRHRRPYLFTPGQVPAYSNYGAALAGYIVQRVSGEPFEAYVERHILAPLAMNRTTFVQPLPARLAGLVSKGYRQSDGSPSAFELVETAPAGSGSATGADMANFMIALLQNGRFGSAQILRPETARLIRTPEALPRPGFDALAHGFFNEQRNGHLVVGHGGDTIVFHTDLNLLPDDGVGMFVSFNSRGERDAVYGARERLFNLFMDRYFTAPKLAMPPALASAARDAQALAGHYESSRRIKTGFISLFYLIQQDQVVPNADGTISVSSIEGKRFREIAPLLWQEVGGTRKLAITEIAGRRSIVDSNNPVGVLQAVPLARNSSVFLLVLGLSLLTLLMTILVWPVGAWLCRKHGLQPIAAGRAALVHRLVRFAVLADILYLIGWYVIVAPILQTVLDGYNEQLDGTIRALQIAAIVPIAAAALGLWNAILTFREGQVWGARVRAILVACALFGILWAAWMGGLIGWSLNY